MWKVTKKVDVTQRFPFYQIIDQDWSRQSGQFYHLHDLEVIVALTVQARGSPLEIICPVLLLAAKLVSPSLLSQDCYIKKNAKKDRRQSASRQKNHYDTRCYFIIYSIFQSFQILFK